MLPAQENAEDTQWIGESAEALPRVALIVDDEMPIRRLLARLLERRGYTVIEAESGDAALSMAREQALGLVVCDVRMPGMTGVDLFAQLCASRPELRRHFVFMSGDTAQPLGDEVMRDMPVLNKPFTSADLDAALEKTQI